jgi:RNA polymerase sigma factor (TIGR02999 family)
MRRILIEAARRKVRLQHGGSFERQELAEVLEINSPIPSDDLLAINEALEKLEAEDPSAAQLVKLRFFVGLSIPDVAELLGVSLRSAEREWTYARSWLHREISNGDTPVAES